MADTHIELKTVQYEPHQELHIDDGHGFTLNIYLPIRGRATCYIGENRPFDSDDPYRNRVSFSIDRSDMRHVAAALVRMADAWDEYDEAQLKGEVSADAR